MAKDRSDDRDRADEAGARRFRLRDFLPSLDPKPNYDLVGRALVRLVLSRAGKVLNGAGDSALVVVNFEVRACRDSDGPNDPIRHDVEAVSVMALPETGECADVVYLTIPGGSGPRPK